MAAKKLKTHKNKIGCPRPSSAPLCVHCGETPTQKSRMSPLFARLTERIYLNMHGAGAAVDVIVVTPQEVERYRQTPCLVIAPALAEGRVVYAA